MLEGEGAIASQVLTQFQRDALEYFVHLCTEVVFSRWRATLGRQTEMFIAKSGIAVNLFTPVLERHVMEGGLFGQKGV